jgi:hypothetical protein
MPNFCKYPSDNHSADNFTVWHGADTPLHLCGYHATQFELMNIIERIQSNA